VIEVPHGVGVHIRAVGLEDVGSLGPRDLVTAGG
jgi:hypothetical protein